MLAASLARSRGIPSEAIAMVDINRERLAFAKEHGLVGKVFCLPPPTPMKGLDGLERSRSQALAFGGGYDIVYECTGAEPCIQMAVFVSPFLCTFYYTLTSSRARKPGERSCLSEWERPTPSSPSAMQRPEK